MTKEGTSIWVNPELRETLDNALEYEHNLGNRHLKNIAQLAAKILWKTLTEEYPNVNK